jgi:hypothetical protein
MMASQKGQIFCCTAFFVTQRSKLRLAPQASRALPNLKIGEVFFFAIKR